MGPAHFRSLLKRPHIGQDFPRTLYKIVNTSFPYLVLLISLTLLYLISLPLWRTLYSLTYLFIFSLFPHSTYLLDNIPLQNHGLKAIRINYFAHESGGWVGLSTVLGSLSEPPMQLHSYTWLELRSTLTSSHFPHLKTWIFGGWKNWGSSVISLYIYVLSPQCGSVRITRNLAWRLRIPKPVEREKSYFALCDIVLDLMQHTTLAKFYSLSESQRPTQFQWKGKKLQL